MRRYWYNAELQLQKQVELGGDLFHHICTVCRQQQGNQFELIADNHKAYLVEIVSVQKKTAQVKVLEQRELPQLPRPYIHLCVSIPKFQKFEWILEKSVELGVKSVYPVFSEYSFVRNKNKLSASKRQRWEKIVLSATQQTGRGDTMEVEKAVQLEQILENIGQKQGAQGLFFYEKSKKGALNEIMRSSKIKESEELFVFIGSEGGYSALEEELFTSKGFSPLSLGGQVLRVETACVSAVSILKYGLGHI